MTTSLLQTAPDPGAVCAAAVGRVPAEVRRIGQGANSRVFRVSFEDDFPPAVVKFYRRDPGDPRDRLDTEFGGLAFLWERGVRRIPRPIARDRERYCAVYEWIPGTVPESGDATPADIDAMVGFLGELRELSASAGALAIPPASEACFSLAGIAASVRSRAERLGRGAVDGDRAPMLAWLHGRFDPLFDDIVRWARERSEAQGIGFETEISPQARTLSPSDFGFHNAIRRPDGTLAYVDFEYFGWDDPAKTVTDVLLHPGMSLSPAIKQHVAHRFVAAFADVPGLAARAGLAYPLFGLKWCTILLNEFLPERVATPASRDGQAVRARQLAKAQRLADQLAREYVDNPYFRAL